MAPRGAIFFACSEKSQRRLIPRRRKPRIHETLVLRQRRNGLAVVVVEGDRQGVEIGLLALGLPWPWGSPPRHAGRAAISAPPGRRRRRAGGRARTGLEGWRARPGPAGIGGDGIALARDRRASRLWLLQQDVIFDLVADDGGAGSARRPACIKATVKLETPIWSGEALFLQLHQGLEHRAAGSCRLRRPVHEIEIDMVEPAASSGWHRRRGGSRRAPDSRARPLS